MTKSQAGRLGGRKTFERHGKNHMAKIGKRGQRTFKRRYRWEPAGTSGWVLLCRKTGRVIASYGVNLLLPVLYRRIIAREAP